EVTPSRRTFTAIGQTAQLSATAYDAQGLEIDGVGFTYESSNSSVVSDDNMRRLTARGIGAATIIVSTACCNASASVSTTVEEQNTGGGEVLAQDGFESGGLSYQANGFRWLGGN